MVTHSSILAWRIPWTKEPGRLNPLGHKESHTTEQLTLTLRHIIANMPQDKGKENLESSKRKMTCHVQRDPKKINSQHHLRNNGGQKSRR